MALLDEVRARRTEPSPAVARAVLAAAEVTEERLAEELDVHRTTVARWLAGTHRPRGANRERYAAVLTALRDEVAR